MRPQTGIGRLKPAPPMQADLPSVAQAVSPANQILLITAAVAGAASVFKKGMKP
jgi:multisubunit Na+/H+ antiporter MnhC subunit